MTDIVHFALGTDTATLSVQRNGPSRSFSSAGGHVDEADVKRIKAECDRWLNNQELARLKRDRDALVADRDLKLKRLDELEEQTERAQAAVGLLVRDIGGISAAINNLENRNRR